MKIATLTTFLLLLSSEVQSQNTWRILDRPTIKDLSRLCFLDSLSGWVVGDSGTILKTTNGGQSWIQQNSTIPHRLIEIFMLDENYGWALAHNYEWGDTAHGTTFLRTVNGGSEWSTRVFRDTFFTSVFFFDSLYGFIAGLWGLIARTTDGGVTWSTTEVDSSYGSGFPIIRLKFFSRNYGYGVGGWIDLSGVIWRTTNGGTFWTATAVGPEPVHDLHFIDSSNIMCIGGDFDVGSGMITTTDAGETWEYTYLGIWGEARALAFRTPAEAWAPLGFAATYMFTLDSGRTWNDTFTPDTTAMFDVVFVDSSTGYMVGDRGTILKYSAPPVSVDDDPFMNLPVTTVLYQNYPNPFNPTTNIQFSISNLQFVSLKVYNLLGQEIAVLVYEPKQRGLYEVTWDAGDLSSGVYFCRLTAGSYVDTRKLILLR
jgi:photosystem II stability/assembly factor-like uncharacterized protein